MDRIRLMVVLHAYQPPYPIQKSEIVRRIIENCYRPFLENLENYPNVKFLLNINASLTEILLEEAPEIIDLISRAAIAGQIDFLESGAYHPIFPLISVEHAKLQLELNNSINSKAFGTSYNPKGVWPPELAVDERMLRLFGSMGYEYAIIPENSVPNNIKGKMAYLMQNDSHFFLVNRNKDLSNAISFDSYKRNVESTVNDFEIAINSSNFPIVFASDLETFGEHNYEYWKYLFILMNDSRIKPILYQEFKESVSHVATPKIISSSWSTEDSELEQDIAYSFWDHPSNPIHQIQQTHFTMLQNSIEKTKGLHTLSFDDLITYMKSSHSCQFWWADREAGRWSKEIIRKGFDLQKKALKIVSSESSGDLIDFSEILFKRLERSLKG
ncbi:MAG: hypothetical protein ACXAB7_02410 [Candidatus Kariarchaeaceae archaeon]